MADRLETAYRRTNSGRLPNTVSASAAAGQRVAQFVDHPDARSKDEGAGAPSSAGGSQSRHQIDGCREDHGTEKVGQQGVA